MRILFSNDSQEILFEARAMEWNLAGVFHFETGSEKYKWLNSVLAVYQGELRMDTGHVRWRTYIKPRRPKYY